MKKMKPKTYRPGDVLFLKMPDGKTVKIKALEKSDYTIYRDEKPDGKKEIKNDD